MIDWPDMGPYPVKVEGYSDEEISYNVMLLQEGGLIVAMKLSADDKTVFTPWRLTLEGHKFWELAEDDTIWRKAVEWAKKSAGAATMESVKLILPEVVRGLFS